ncbi:MAG: DUF3566 domain-containing protein [Acidimicrobiales bacterium]|nr:DUF3566 domain-containing protein [Acidimicrobiales bacterium]
MALDDNDEFKKPQSAAEEGSSEVDYSEEFESTPIPVESSADLLARISGGDSDGEDLATAPVFRRDPLRALKNRSDRSKTGRKLGLSRRSQAELDSQTPAGGYRVRRVRRLIRHVEPWSVLKVSLVFYLCVWGLLVIATRMLWSAAEEAGTISKIESFIEELFALESFVFDSAQIFRIFVLGGLVLVVGWIGVTVVLVVLFNLISDLTGGIRFTMVEEETAVRQRRLRRGDILVGNTGDDAGSLSETSSGE